MNLLKTEKECIDYIHSCGRFGKKEGLSNMRALLNALGNPQDGLKCIHVAGTNGKGSVTSMISAVLTCHGYKVGMNTSPFIEIFNERLQINGNPIPAEKLVFYTNAVKNAVDKLNNDNCHPIEFELITAIGFLYFKEECCDYVILECGIGGRLDSTNVIKNPLLCVISAIGIDHTEILGNTIPEIASEKAGIIKRDTYVAVHPFIDNTALEVIENAAKELNAALMKSTVPPRTLHSDLSGTDFEFDNTRYHINLLGSYQVGNAALAITASKQLLKLGIVTDDDILHGIAVAAWKCRFEYINNGFNCIIDGAHNYQGICEFEESVKMYLSDYEKIFVIGMLNEKDFENSAEVLKKLDGKIIVTDVPSTRQTSGNDIYMAVKSLRGDAVYIPNYISAVDYAKENVSRNGFVCVAGSLYLAGAVRTYIMNKNF